MLSLIPLMVIPFVLYNLISFGFHRRWRGFAF